MSPQRVLVTYAETDGDAEIALRAAEDVQEALFDLAIDAKARPIEHLTKRDLAGTEVIFALDTTPPPTWLRQLPGADPLKAYLASQGIPFTGSPPPAAALAKDKQRAKAAIAKFHTSVPKTFLPEQVSRFDLPLIVKPGKGAASRGVTFVQSLDQLRALLLAGAAGDNPLIEEYIAGREITVAVVQSLGQAQAYRPVEVFLDEAIFSAERKSFRPYPACRVLEPSDVAFDPCCAAAIRAFTACGCAGYARVDIRFSDERGAVVLEINSSPRLCRDEYIAISAIESGVAYTELIHMILSAAKFQ